MENESKVIVLEEGRTAAEMLGGGLVVIEQKRFGSNKESRIYLNKEMLKTLLEKLA